MKIVKSVKRGKMREKVVLRVLMLFMLFVLSAAAQATASTIAAGNGHSMTIKSDGTLWAWGGNSQGQLGDGTTSDKSSPVQIASGSTFIAVAAGQDHTVAVKTDGTLWAWGDNYYGQLGDGTTVDKSSPVQIASGSTFSAVAAGAYHTVAIKTDGTLWAWGWNSSSQLGDSTGADKSSPVQIASGSTFIAVAAGRIHTVAVKTDGTLWAWGDNYYGELGDGTFGGLKHTPVQIASGSTFSAVAAGWYHTLAIKTDGTLWAWGDNSQGQLGDGETVNKLSPVQIASNSTFTAVAAGANHTVAVKTDGTLWAWGANSRGQLSDGTAVNRSSPVQIAPGSTFAAVAAGWYHTLAIKTDGTLWAGGDNTWGQLGDGTPADKPSPVQIASGSTFIAVAAGSSHSLAIKMDGTLWAGGDNTRGQLGDGTTADKSSPVQVASGSTFIAVAAGSSHSLAIKMDGTLWAWGNNAWGQLGDGTTADKSSPVQVASGSTFSAAATGWYHSLAIKTDGTLWAWGYNAWGQLGDGTTATKSSPVQIASGSTFTAVAAGKGYTVAIKTDGTLWAWGFNLKGQLGDGTTAPKSSLVQIASGSTFTAVAAGNSHTVAIKTDGTLWAWGDNSQGQLGDGTTVDKSSPVQIASGSIFTAVAAGEYHTVAVKTDGTLWAWGDNSQGQLGDGTAWREAPELIMAGMAVGPFFVFPFAGPGGGISPSTVQSVSYNSTTSFEITSGAGYIVGIVTGCNGTLVGSTYTTGPITGTCAVSSTFVPTTWKTLGVTVSGSGTVHTVPGTDLACTTSCGTSYNNGTVVTLTASPGVGQVFTGWGGVCSGTGNCIITMDASKEVTATFILIPPASSVTLTADKTSPGALGTVVSFTAEAIGGSESYEYQFKLKTGTTWTTPRAWGSSNTFEWIPANAGIYTIQVRARNVGSTAAYEAYRNLTYTVVEDPPVTGVSLTTDQPSPAQYSTLDIVQYTALATGGTGTCQYQFMIKDDSIWTTPQDWGDSPVFNWTPEQVGVYTIQVRARNAGSVAAYEAYRDVTFVVVDDAPVTSVSLAITNGKESPSLLNTVGTVQFTAAATGTTGNYQYQYLVKNNAGTTWTTLRVYDPSPDAAWSPTQAGSYTIQVRVRNTGSLATYEAYRNIVFVVVTDDPITAVSLVANKTSPKTLGAAGTITFTAQASGTTNSYEYQFLVKSSVTGLWITPQGWSDAKTFPWTPLAAGTYTIQVRARNVGSPAAYEAYRSKTFSITE